jgi:hypothetical protein
MTMKPGKEKSRSTKGGRTLVKAFAFAGAILGVGMFGLAKAVIMLGATLGWLREETTPGPFPTWLLAGAGVGLLAGLVLVALERRRGAGK